MLKINVEITDCRVSLAEMKFISYKFKVNVISHGKKKEVLVMKVVRLKPDQPDWRLQPCVSDVFSHELSRKGL